MPRRRSTDSIPNQLETTQHSLDELVGALNDFATQDYVDRWGRIEESKRKRFTLTATILGVVLAVMIGLNTSLLFQTLQIAETNRTSANLLVECLTPSSPGDVHACYEDRISNFDKVIEVVRKERRKEVKRLEQILNRIQSSVGSSAQ